MQRLDEYAGKKYETGKHMYALFRDPYENPTIAAPPRLTVPPAPEVDGLRDTRRGGAIQSGPGSRAIPPPRGMQVSHQGEKAT